MATASRRRRDSKEQPIFLRKTYQMISTCPADIAGWSDAGDSFIIFNPEVFALNIIPNFFKHSNFSSFVRQLNCYGFHKVRAESSLNFQKNSAEIKYWEFKHENFQKGKPNLLLEIKRAKHLTGATMEAQDVEELRLEVTALSSQLADVTKSVRELTKVVNGLLGIESSRSTCSNIQLDVPASPKRKKKRKATILTKPESSPTTTLSTFSSFSSDDVRKQGSFSSDMDSRSDTVSEEAPVLSKNAGPLYEFREDNGALHKTTILLPDMVESLQGFYREDMQFIEHEEMAAILEEIAQPDDNNERDHMEGHHHAHLVQSYDPQPKMFSLSPPNPVGMLAVDVTKGHSGGLRHPLDHGHYHPTKIMFPNMPLHM